MSWCSEMLRCEIRLQLYSVKWEWKIICFWKHWIYQQFEQNCMKSSICSLKSNIWWLPVFITCSSKTIDSHSSALSSLLSSNTRLPFWAAWALPFLNPLHALASINSPSCTFQLCNISFFFIQYNRGKCLISSIFPQKRPPVFHKFKKTLGSNSLLYWCLISPFILPLFFVFHRLTHIIIYMIHGCHMCFTYL